MNFVIYTEGYAVLKKKKFSEINYYKILIVNSL